mmetsp:Transcript_30216/g.29511  ORF Transcript_30216/g.29511 Transcript_30216/m.29511 type:complete len:107 (-) Transcript_30216:745-1065(-)
MLRRTLGGLGQNVLLLVLKLFPQLLLHLLLLLARLLLFLSESLPLLLFLLLLADFFLQLLNEQIILQPSQVVLRHDSNSHQRFLEVLIIKDLVEVFVREVVIFNLS